MAKAPGEYDLRIKTFEATSDAAKRYRAILQVLSDIDEQLSLEEGKDDNKRADPTGRRRPADR